jgi:predicted amidohydrolase
MSSSREIRLALAQMRVDGGAFRQNVERAVARVEQAATAGAQIVVLPECLDVGWTHPSSSSFAGEIPAGPVCQRLKQAAREKRIMICAGLTERAGPHIHNAAVLIDSDGKMIRNHRKIHELDFACETYRVGNSIAVTDSSLGPIGVMICADGFAPGLALGRALGVMGARLILSPCAWAVPAAHDNTRDPYGALWRDSYSPVAAEFGLWIAAVSNVGPITGGPWQGRMCIGNSMLVGPAGRVEKTLPYGIDQDVLEFADITLAPQKTAL